LPISDSACRRNAASDPDVHLMLEVQRGSAAAFEELMFRYQDRVLTVLSHLVRDRDLAEDLAQDVFLRVYRARHSYTPSAKFCTWLFTIVNHTAASALRRRSRSSERQLAGSESGPLGANPLERLALAASGQMPTRQLDKAELCTAVRTALDGLNQRQRLAVLLSKFENMNYADIAETMDLTPQAVKSLLFRARDALRAALEPYFTEGCTAAAPQTPQPPRACGPEPQQA
jgi:RNA polymerase sigma-70 factor (ECF subfamily)